MDVRVNKNDKIVEWDVRGKTISIYNEDVLYAFMHGKNMLMVKEKYETSGSGFSAYDEEGKLVFSYKYLENHLNYRDRDISVIDGTIISADYEEDKRKLVILKESDEIRSILVYDDNADILTEINAPRGYIFVSLKNNAGNIMVVAQGINDLTRDSFGRNDWNFSIDFENLYIERQSITQ